MERRLAAILAADVVGYSRLMEADEAGTLDVLKARRRQVFDPLPAKHRSRWLASRSIDGVQAACRGEEGSLSTAGPLGFGRGDTRWNFS